MITLPWPDRRLLPNARIHYHERAKLVRQAREASCLITIATIPLSARRALEESEGPIALAITFKPPDKRRRDLDGMLSALKGGLDGIADGLRVDDYRFTLALCRGETVKLGAVVIEILEPRVTTC